MPTVAPRVRTLLVALTVVTAGLSARASQPGNEPGDASQTPASQAGQTPTEQPKGTGIVMGQVVDASTGKPIGGAIVVMTGGTSSSITLPTGEVVFGSVAASPGAPAASAAPRQIMTNSDGRYLFREISRGRYLLRVTSPGYLAGGLGQNRPTGVPQSIELTSDDEKVGDTNVRLWKSASLSGTIVDETGSPAIGYPVRVIRRTMSGGKPKLSPGVSATTDDRGAYRISSLTPGDYLVAILSTQTTMPAATAEAFMQQMMAGGSSASEVYRELSSSGVDPSMTGFRVGDLLLQTDSYGRDNAPAPGDDGRVFVYPALYYPAAAVASQAEVLTLTSGEDRSGIDLQLKLMPSLRVSGTVMGPDGPARNLGVKLFPAGADEFTWTETGIEVAATVTAASGAFTFLGVTPGQYTLKALRIPRPLSSPSSSMMTTIEISGPNGMIMGMSSGGPSAAPPPPLPTELTLSAATSVSVADSDVTGLSVALRTGARIAGRIVFEGSKNPPSPEQLQRANISINPAGGSSQIQFLMASKRVETDGRFSSVGFPPGRYLVSATLPNAPGTSPGGSTGWTFKSAMFGGRDVSDEGLEIDAEDISGVVITFSDRTTELGGTVVDSKGQPDRNADVIVMPADSQRWKEGVMNARRLRNVRTTTTGAFSLSGLPPGQYLIAAVSDETLGEWQDPKVLEKIAAAATKVTLGDGEKRSEQLTTKSIR